MRFYYNRNFSSHFISPKKKSIFADNLRKVILAKNESVQEKPKKMNFMKRMFFCLMAMIGMLTLQVQSIYDFKVKFIK